MTTDAAAVPYSETWWRTLLGDGSPAMNFHNDARVWSDMAVRDVVVRALAQQTARGEALEYLRPEVLAFARLMEGELRKHDDREGWHFLNVWWLWKRLLQEKDELLAALHFRDRTGLSEVSSSLVGQEAADVANFAMMIASRVAALQGAKP